MQQTEICVAGIHFIQEDSAAEIGNAVKEFIQTGKATAPTPNYPLERPRGMEIRYQGETLRLEFDPGSGVAHLEFNLPKSLNALNLQMAKELAECAADLDTDPGVRALIISGAGKAFCAGGDLSAVHQAVQQKGPSGGELLLKQMTGHLHMAISRFARMNAPVIAVVTGPAAGAGFSLACQSDMCLASPKATFSMAYTGAGLVPDGSSTYFLSKHIGHRRALELMLTNKSINAKTAFDWGLVNDVVHEKDIMEEAFKIAKTLAKGATQAYGEVKRLLLSGEGLEAQMELESRAISGIINGKDAQNGVAAFVNRKKPVFTGRR